MCDLTFQPKPVVDTIKEEEKYGNHGDKFYNVGRAVVSGAEGVSNFVNSVLEVILNSKLMDQEPGAARHTLFSE